MCGWGEFRATREYECAFLCAVFFFCLACSAAPLSADQRQELHEFKLKKHQERFAAVLSKTNLSAELLDQQCAPDSPFAKIASCKRYGRLITRYFTTNRKNLNELSRTSPSTAMAIVKLPEEPSIPPSGGGTPLATPISTVPPTPLAAVCGNLSCEAGESCDSCSLDCGHLCIPRASFQISPLSISVKPSASPGSRSSSAAYGAGSVFEARILAFSTKQLTDVEAYLTADNFGPRTFRVTPQLPPFASSYSVPSVQINSTAPSLLFPVAYNLITVRWESAVDQATGNYALGLYSRSAGGYVGINLANFIIADSPWMLLHGDGAASNLGVGISGDRWPTLRAYQLNLLKNALDFTRSEPVLKNYSPSINIIAKRSITGLQCRKCIHPDGSLDPVCPDIKALLRAADLARWADLILSFAFPPVLVGTIAIDKVVSNIVEQMDDVFQCPKNLLLSSLSAAPASIDVFVAYANGENSPNWWRSNVAISSTDPLALLGAYLGSGEAGVISNIIYLATNQEETAFSDYLYSFYNDDGRTLLHEFGHAFAKLPDFYDWDENCLEYRGMMCTVGYNFQSPTVPGWYPSDPGVNRAYDRVTLVNSLNKRIGSVSSLTTGVTFPTYNTVNLTSCEAKKFQVGYAAGAKQMSYLSSEIFDVQGRRVFAYASELPAPNSSGTDIYLGSMPNWPTSSYTSIGFGYPGVDRYMNFVSRAVYYMRIRHGDLFNPVGDGNQFTMGRRNAVPNTGSTNCSPWRYR